MFKPHVTVACVVHTQGKFLIVEETINNEKRWNQPAGHLEADETLIQAAERELWEETGFARHHNIFYGCTNGWHRTIPPFYVSLLSLNYPPNCQHSPMTAILIVACG